MNIIDIIALIPTLFFAVMGYKKGVVKQLFGVIGLFLGVIASLKLSQIAMEQLADIEKLNSQVLPFFVYAIIFIGVLALVILIGRFVEKVLKAAQLNFANRISGAILGVLKAFMLLSLFIWLADLASFFDNHVKSESIAYGYIKDLTPKAISLIGEIMPSLKELITNIEAYFDKIADNIDRLN